MAGPVLVLEGTDPVLGAHRRRRCRCRACTRLARQGRDIPLLARALGPEALCLPADTQDLVAVRQLLGHRGRHPVDSEGFAWAFLTLIYSSLDLWTWSFLSSSLPQAFPPFFLSFFPAQLGWGHYLGTRLLNVQ